MLASPASGSQNWRFGLAGVWSGASARLVFSRLGKGASMPEVSCHPLGNDDQRRHKVNAIWKKIDASHYNKMLCLWSLRER